MSRKMVMVMVYLMLSMGVVGGVAVGNGITERKGVDCQRGDGNVGCLPPAIAIANAEPRKLTTTSTVFVADRPLGTAIATPSPFTITMSPVVTPTTSTRFDSEQDAEQSPEENLTPNLPPSSRRRRWGLSFALVALIGLGCLLWVYRHSLPNPMDYLPSSLSLPHISLPSGLRDHIPQLSLPTISSTSFALPGKSNSSSSSRYNARRLRQSRSSFRPEANSLLRWWEEEDPSLPNPSSSRPTSSWRSKLPSLSLSTGKLGRGRYPRPSGSGGGGGHFLGDLEDEGSDYEEVGLLPSPNPYQQVAGRSGGTTSYGTV